MRKRVGDRVVLTTYGRSSGFCVDPIEKKPLNHFLPGTSVLSFGTAGCNLACRFCQNWDISKAREWDRLADSAAPEEIARTAHRLGCRSVAFTYNDPVIFAEYAIDAADACRDFGIRSVAVTAGYISADARAEFYQHIDAANVDLKAFTEGFCHPDFKMLDKPHTPPATLTRARQIALAKGLYYVYTGNVHDMEGGSTWCPGCGKRLIERDWYTLGEWNLEAGRCDTCGHEIAGVFEKRPGKWGARRMPVVLTSVTHSPLLKEPYRTAQSVELNRLFRRASNHLVLSAEYVFSVHFSRP